MNEIEFIRSNGSTWKKLESEIKFFKKQVNPVKRLLFRKVISKERVDEFIVLYNKTANDLSYCRTYFGENDTAKYLNKLLGNAHPIIYRHSKEKIGVWGFFKNGFPALVKANKISMLFATVVFAASILVSFIYTCIDFENAYAFIEPSQTNIRTEENTLNMSGSDMFATTMYLFANNARVALIALAGCLTLGIFSIYLLITNGIQLGVLAGIAMHQGSFTFFLSLILPHGVTELTAIVLAAGAGIAGGYSFCVPGKLSRIDSVINKTRESGKIIVGVIVLLAISAIIEGCFTPLDINYIAKFAFVIVITILTVLYFLFLGRKK